MRSAKPRLARPDYIGAKTYHVTLTTNQRAPTFEDTAVGRQFEALLIECASKSTFDLLAYCFMPDHLHILCAGNHAGSDLLKFVQLYKQRTGYWFKASSGDQPWQQSFFDRVLRQDEDPAVVALYILSNPEAEDLPSNSPAYSLRGGEMLRDAATDGAEASSLHSDS